MYDVSSITGANIVIGAGGAAVVAGNSGNGGDGGDTTIVDLGISAGGGKGGNSTGNSAGGTPGAPSVGTIFQWSGKVARGGRRLGRCGWSVSQQLWWSSSRQYIWR